MNNKIKMWRGRQIWFYDSCAYLDGQTFNTVIDKYDYFYDILDWLREKGFEVEYDQNLHFNSGETTWIQFDTGKKVGITNGAKNEIYIVASLDVSGIDSFNYFDNVTEFERFYKRVKDKMAELIKKNEIEYSNWAYKNVLLLG